MKKGLFIVFEGPDGSGQSTQAEMLADWFERNGFRVKLTKEPTNNVIGGIIRSILRGELRVSIRTLALLFAADRSHHVETEIEPLLKKGITVISDRYTLSTLVYESINGLKVEWLLKINELFPKPDITFILDVPGKICIERIKKSRFGFELFETEEKLERVRQRYLELSKLFENTYIVDGTPLPEIVHKEIIKIVTKYI